MAALMEEKTPVPVDEETLREEERAFLSTLSRQRGWRTSFLYNLQGFWFSPQLVSGILKTQNHFQVQEDDILLATSPKTGTTWLKALAFCIVSRNHYSKLMISDTHPLLINNPHHLVSSIEFMQVAITSNTRLSSPRLIHTHLPTKLLPVSVKEMGCRVVYLCRNVGDHFVSSWKYFNNVRTKGLEPLPIEEAFELFCNGISHFGPYWDHVLGYWKDCRERPHNVLFLRYEELKKDLSNQLKRLADFLGFPFTRREESEGVIDKISELCSFENLTGLEVNRSGLAPTGFNNSFFFERAVVGGSAEYLMPEMLDRLRRITSERLHGSDLDLDI